MSAIDDLLANNQSCASNRFSDAGADVRQSVARIRASPFVPYLDQVRGFIYDIDSGKLYEIEPSAR